MLVRVAVLVCTIARAVLSLVVALVRRIHSQPSTFLLEFDCGVRSVRPVLCWLSSLAKCQC